MSYASEEAQFNEDVFLNSTDEPDLPTGYSENFTYGLGQTVDENLSISEYLVRNFNGQSLTDRNEQLRELRNNGTLSDDEFASFITPDTRGIRMPDYSAMAEYANATYGADIRTDTEINDEMFEGLATRRRQAQDVFERQTFTGAVGEVLGGLNAFALEPAAIAAIPLEWLMLGRYAYTLSQATTRLSRASKIAGISATANMATETAIQPILHNWHEEMGVEMTWKDSLFTIASVGAMSGVITGLATGIKSKARFEAEQRNARIRSGDVSVRDVRDILEETRRVTDDIAIDDEATALLRQTENELNSVPDGPAREHFERMDDAERRVNNAVETKPAKDEVEYEIDDKQLALDYETRIASSETMSDMKAKDLFDDVLHGETNAAKRVERMQELHDVMKTCLLGGK